MKNTSVSVSRAHYVLWILLLPSLCCALSTTPSSLSQTTGRSGSGGEYPWTFSGRLWFRPAFVRTPSSPPPGGVSILSLFGWTVGGVVALEYDDSLVGPYREFVTMGGLVWKGGAVGQWGSHLYVSSKEAADACDDIWNLPAELASIDFNENSTTTSLSVRLAPDASASDTKRQRIVVDGWQNTRIQSFTADETPERRGGLPVLWTPTIKALWTRFLPIPVDTTDNDRLLPLHRLRLSASSIRLRVCGQEPSDLLGVPFGIGLVVDNILIEIAERNGSL